MISIDNNISQKLDMILHEQKNSSNKSNDALSLVTHSKLNLKKMISIDNNISQKLDMILQILNEQKNSSNKSDESYWKD